MLYVLRFAFFVSFLLLLSFCPFANPACFGQTSSFGPEKSGQRVITPERQEFERLLSEWKPMVGELSKLRYQYFDVKRKPEEGEIVIVDQTPERKALRKEFDGKFEAAEKKYDQVIDAAVFAYARNPEQNRDLEIFLLQTLHYFMTRDMYEDAQKMSQILLSQKINNPLVIRAAAESAMYTGDYDVARTYIEKIKELGLLTDYQFQESDFRYVDLFEKFWNREKEMRKLDERKGDCPRVIFYTTKGEIELLLFEDQAPNTVANFIFLVEKGYYTKLDFHRVISGFMAQGGGEEQLKDIDLKTLQCKVRRGGPGYTILDETPKFDMEKRDFPEDARFHWRGSISMAKTDEANSAGSQFFIMLTPRLQQNGTYTVFGRVIRGMDVVCRLARRDPGSVISRSQLPQADKIIEAKVVYKRDHKYSPNIIPDDKQKPPFPKFPVVLEDQPKDKDEWDPVQYIMDHSPAVDRK